MVHMQKHMNTKKGIREQKAKIPFFLEKIIKKYPEFKNTFP